MLLLGLDDGDVIGERPLGAHLAGGIPRQHDFDPEKVALIKTLNAENQSHFDSLDAEDTLAKEDVTAGGIDVVVARITTVDHESVDELHGLGSLTSQLSRNNDLATLGARLHDESEHTVAGTANGQTSDKLVAERLGLGDGAETAGGDLLGVEIHRVLGEVEPLLDDGGQLANPAALLSQNVLCPGSHDDDLRLGGSHTHLDTGVAIFGELASQELVQLSLEDSVGDKLEK